MIERSGFSSSEVPSRRLDEDNSGIQSALNVTWSGRGGRPRRTARRKCLDRTSSRSWCIERCIPNDFVESTSSLDSRWRNSTEWTRSADDAENVSRREIDSIRSAVRWTTRTVRRAETPATAADSLPISPDGNHLWFLLWMWTAVEWDEWSLQRDWNRTVRSDSTRTVLAARLQTVPTTDREPNNHRCWTGIERRNSNEGQSRWSVSRGQERDFRRCPDTLDRCKRVDDKPAVNEWREDRRWWRRETRRACENNGRSQDPSSADASPVAHRVFQRASKCRPTDRRESSTDRTGLLGCATE